MARRAAFLLPLLTLTALPAPAEAQGGEVYERVVEKLGSRFHDLEWRRETLPRIAARLRPQARASATAEEERAVIQYLLEQVPSSHTALYSEATWRRLFDDLANRRRPTLGLELVHLEEGFFVHTLLEGGPAAEAGVLSGDRVLTVDGLPPEKSPRLDWRSDDASLPDPPVHALRCSAGEEVVLELERHPGLRLGVRLRARVLSSLEASLATARVQEVEGRRVAWFHLRMVHSRQTDKVLRQLLIGRFAEAEALVLDLRGRGGSASMAQRLLALFDGPGAVWTRPVVALVDGATRSAKEVLAWELRERGIARLIGERTAGAVIPATFARVAPDAILMFPSTTLGAYTERLEGKGVEPDVLVRAAGPWSAGADPILEAGLQEAARLAATASRRSRSG